jgi:hypothetical protein
MAIAGSLPPVAAAAAPASRFCAVAFRGNIDGGAFRVALSPLPKVIPASA